MTRINTDPDFTYPPRQQVRSLDGTVQREFIMFKCNCPHETRSGCAEPRCPFYVKPRDAAESTCDLPPSAEHPINYRKAFAKSATPQPAPDAMREALIAAKAAMLRTRTASIAGCTEGYGKPELWADELFASHGDLTKAIKLCADAILLSLPVQPGDDEREAFNLCRFKIVDGECSKCGALIYQECLGDRQPPQSSREE